MKTFIKKLTQLLVIATLAFAGASFADATFVYDPLQQGNGITSIGNTYTSANDYNSVSVNIPNSQDSEEFYVFMSYQNGTSPAYTLNNVRARLTYSGTSTVTFSGTLTASNGGSATDTAQLTGLPSSWNIQLLEATKVNTHGSYCGAAYEYDVPIGGLMSTSGAYIGNLDTAGVSSINGYSGACSQGHVVAKFRVTNTGSSQVGAYEWQTGPWGTCINNIQERDVDCVNTQTGQTVADSYCSAAGPRPADTRTCTSGSSQFDVDTLSATDIDDDSAELNGDLVSGGPASSFWFVLSHSDHNPGCNSVSGVNILYATNIGGGSNPNFSVFAFGLADDTRYYYRACVSGGGSTGAGQVLSFTTDDDGTSGDSEPDADTQTEDDVDDDSARLIGRIRMNDFDDGEVFFVYGQDRNMVEDTEDDYDSYYEARQDEDDEEYQVVLVDSNNDDSGWSTYRETVTNLDEDERYYYQICVGYYDNGDELVCGGVEQFTTGDNGSGDVEIRTTSVQDSGPTFAILCGDLEDDGGDSSLRTRIEFRQSSGSSSWAGSNYIQRGEGAFCVQVNNLRVNTKYQYRACTDEGDCGDIRTFTTSSLGAVSSNIIVNTLYPSNIGTSSAILNGAFQGSSVEPTQVWFEWGNTPSLGTQKQVFTKVASSGTFSDSFSGLRSCRDYYYRAVARNSTGIKYGNIISFRTSCVINAGGQTVAQPPKVSVIEKVEETTIDLDSLGLGLSLIRLDIDNGQEVLFRDQVVEYEVTWENISTIDLDNIDVKVTLPSEVEVTNVSRGRFDADENVVYYNIESLNQDDSGSLLISGVVTKGSLGDVITAEATAAYNNPVNDAQENATDYDIDEFVLNDNFGTASVFGLSNITFLGWLTILLGLLIIFLVARWLYLEREELRAQAYAQGYRPELSNSPRYDYSVDQGYGYGSQTDQPVSTPHNPAPEEIYQPYRPNRG